VTFGLPAQAILTSCRPPGAVSHWAVTSQSITARVSDSATLRAIVERATVHEVLMGAQDNLTNVLAVVLGVTIGSGRADFVALAGLSAGIAEAVSMGGVLYNATRAEQRLQRRSSAPAAESTDHLAPAWSGIVCFAAALVAGLIPLIPFAVLPMSVAVLVTAATSVVGLFVLGSLTGRIGGDSWLAEGVRLVAVAGCAALAAAVVGSVLHVG
jgi:VIT1/CCC1 family predicted Fe2+/Mn2+ transporter